MEKIEIKVNGMVCEGCENRVKNALGTIEGVDKVEANHNTGIVTIIIKKEVQRLAIEEKLDDLGFEVEKEF